MKIEIDLNDYFSKNDIRKIAEEVIKDEFREQACDENNLERLFINYSYDYVFKMINDMFDGKLEEILKKSIEEVCRNVNTISFEMFRTPSFGEKEGPAVRILAEECEKARPLIAETAKKCMDAYAIERMSEDCVSETIADAVTDRLFGKEN